MPWRFLVKYSTTKIRFSVHLTRKKQLFIGSLRLSVVVDSDVRQEGLSVLLTDPQGRMYGMAPETGELINDFGAGGILGRPNRIRPKIELGIEEGQLVSEEFTLSATATKSVRPFHLGRPITSIGSAQNAKESEEKYCPQPNYSIVIVMMIDSR